MRKTVSLFLGALCLTLLATTAVAQTDEKPNMQGPPKVLYIVREEVKPGKAFAHSQHEAAWTQAFVKAKMTTPSLGLSSVTGVSENWFVVTYNSFADLQKDSDRMEKDPVLSKINMEYGAKEAEYINETRTIIARYKPEYSYHPDFKLGEFHYFSVGTLRPKTGEDMDEFYKPLTAAREKANQDAHTVVYEVTSGMPSGTLLIFTPLKDISKWDEPPNKDFQAALKDANFNQIFGKTVMSLEWRLFAISPRISVVPESVAALDPAFWHPKQMMTKSQAATKVKPAAKKTQAPPAKP